MRWLDLYCAAVSCQYYTGNWRGIIVRKTNGLRNSAAERDTIPIKSAHKARSTAKHSAISFDLDVQRHSNGS